MNTPKLIAAATMPLMALMAWGCTQGENDEPVAAAPESVVAQGDEFAAENASDTGFTGAGAVPEGMEITFEDDFDNTTGIPDPEKWVLCKKGKNWAEYQSESYDQAYTKDGSLFLIGEESGGELKTGGIETRGKYEFEHGKVECRAKVVTMPQGTHEGIWMMPAPPALEWPKSGELDIMEHINKEGVAYQTVHSWYIDDMGHKEKDVSYSVPEINKEDWNIYGIEWTAEKIIYTVNGKKTLEYPNLHLEGEDGAYQWPFNHPYYLILSVSMNGTWEGPVNVSELPLVFQIDWIRVMQPSGTDAGVPKITM